MKDTAFDVQSFEDLKPQLTSFCYRMLGSADDDLSRFFSITRPNCEGSKFIPVTVNGGYPALAQYMPSQEPGVLVPWGIHVLEVKEHCILHVQNFISTPLLARFGLPERMYR